MSTFEILVGTSKFSFVRKIAIYGWATLVWYYTVRAAAAVTLQFIEKLEPIQVAQNG